MLVEEGNPQGFHNIRSARKFLLEEFNQWSKNYGAPKSVNAKKPIYVVPPPANYAYHQIYAKVVSPCTHDEVCPLRKGQMCVFAQRFQGGLIRKEGLQRFAYVVIQKTATGSPSVQSNQKMDPWTSPEVLSRLEKSKILTPREILLQYASCETKEDAKDLSDVLQKEVSQNLFLSSLLMIFLVDPVESVQTDLNA